MSRFLSLLFVFAATTTSLAVDLDFIQTASSWTMAAKGSRVIEVAGVPVTTVPDILEYFPGLPLDGVLDLNVEIVEDANGLTGNVDSASVSGAIAKIKQLTGRVRATGMGSDVAPIKKKTAFVQAGSGCHTLSDAATSAPSTCAIAEAAMGVVVSRDYKIDDPAASSIFNLAYGEISLFVSVEAKQGNLLNSADIDTRFRADFGPYWVEARWDPAEGVNGSLVVEKCIRSATGVINKTTDKFPAPAGVAKASFNISGVNAYKTHFIMTPATTLQTSANCGSEISAYIDPTYQTDNRVRTKACVGVTSPPPVREDRMSGFIKTNVAKIVKIL